MVLVCLCGLLATFGFGSLLTAAETNGYVGAVGEQKMILSLTWHDDGIEGGNYYCPSGSGKIYALCGSDPREGGIGAYEIFQWQSHCDLSLLEEH